MKRDRSGHRGDDASEVAAADREGDVFAVAKSRPLVSNRELPRHQQVFVEGRAQTGDMSEAELQELEEIKGLIARGLLVGVLTYAEIATATAELGLEETQVEELHGLLERGEIELVEEVDPATAPRLTIDPAPKKRTRRKAQPDLEPEATTDGLQLFLKTLDKVRLLSASEPDR